VIIGPVLHDTPARADKRWPASFLKSFHAVAERIATVREPVLRDGTSTLTLVEGNTMNWDRIEGNWQQLKGRVKEQWGDLTDDDFDVVAGRRDQLAGKIQERYGIAKDEAERQVKEWEHSADETWFERTSTY
jgi:uncharacterized protein YjbJ (UPF0337 family)